MYSSNHISHKKFHTDPIIAPSLIPQSESPATIALFSTSIYVYNQATQSYLELDLQNSIETEIMDARDATCININMLRML